MINTILYSKPYILNSRIYPLDKNREFRSAVINLIEPIYSNYKPIEAYNLDISLPLNAIKSPGSIISCCNLLRVVYLDSPYLCDSFIKPISKKYLTKKIQAYILSIIFIICKLLYFLRGKLK